MTASTPSGEGDHHLSGLRRNLMQTGKTDMIITTAQRTAAAQLPFELSDAEIARQFNADGTSRPFESKFPMLRARELARSAMEAIASPATALAA